MKTPFDMIKLLQKILNMKMLLSGGPVCSACLGGGGGKRCPPAGLTVICVFICYCNPADSA